QLPRLRRMWTHLSRIEGGIGLRGPGETQIEVDRRRARTRIRDLERSLEHIQTRKSLETSGRKEFFTVALVGYTNVGKTALMNALTGEALLAENRLFATLDATTRRLDLPSGQSALLSDTVGFIQNIPHHLVASFHATLEEVREADLILHVVDVSHPERRSQVQSVDGVLLNLKCTDKPTLYVLNKCDLLEEGAKPMHLEQFEFSVLVSARTGVGLEALRNQIESRAEQNRVEMDVVLPASEGKVAAYIAEHGNVLERHYEDARVHLKARLLPRHAHRVRKMMAELTQCE
ncbi:MAG: GTPase HflX, partial [Armatimonadetes bacterium CG_4_9_14_3_um_filter_58_7]